MFPGEFFACPAALYSLMSHQGVVGEQKIYQLYMPSYQNKSCSACLLSMSVCQYVSISFQLSYQNKSCSECLYDEQLTCRAAKEPALVYLLVIVRATRLLVPGWYRTSITTITNSTNRFKLL